MDRPNRPVQSYVTRRILALLLIAGVSGMCGCSGARLFSRREPTAQEIENDPNHSIAGIHGPTERLLNQSRWKQKREDLAKNGDEETKAILSKYDAAQALYDEGKFAQAETQFKAIVKVR